MLIDTICLDSIVFTSLPIIYHRGNSHPSTRGWRTIPRVFAHVASCCQRRRCIGLVSRHGNTLHSSGPKFLYHDWNLRSCCLSTSILGLYENHLIPYLKPLPTACARVSCSLLFHASTVFLPFSFKVTRLQNPSIFPWCRCFLAFLFHLSCLSGASCVCSFGQLLFIFDHQFFLFWVDTSSCIREFPSTV